MENNAAIVPYNFHIHLKPFKFQFYLVIFYIDSLVIYQIFQMY